MSRPRKRRSHPSRDAPGPSNKRVCPDEGERSSSSGKAFISGAIVRIKLHQFVTYEDVEFFPEAGLNVIVGPNGAGKSSIVCALCLGLGGATKSIGRAKEVKDYVKKSHKEGWIELELFKADKKRENNVIVRRFIDIQNVSKWYLNGKKVNLSDVKKLTARLNIKVDNLCQFLAQERVVEFARQDPMKLLIETEKAVETSELHDQHMALVDLRNKEKINEQELQGISTQLGELKVTQRQARSAQIRFEQRETLTKKIEILKKRFPWAKYWLRKIDFERAKVNYTDATKAASDAQGEDAPIREKIRAMETQCAKLDNGVKTNKRELDSISRKKDNCGATIDKYDDEVANKKMEAEGLVRSAADREREQRKLEDKLREQKENLEGLPEDRELKDLETEIAAEMTHKRREKAVIHAELETIQNEKNEYNSEIRGLNQRLVNLQNVDAMRDRKLFTRRTISKRLFDWVQQNKHNFHGPVYGPIAREIRVKSKLHANYVDMQMNNSIKFGYVVENNHDWVMISEKAKAMREKITTIETSASNGPIPRGGNLDYLRQHGVSNWLDQVVECPPVVRTALMDFTGFHQTAISEQPLTPQQLLNVLQSNHQDRNGCKSLYTPTDCHRVTISRYGNRAASTGVSRMRDGNVIPWGVETKEKEEVEAHLVNFNGLLQQNAERLGEAQERERPITRAIDEIAQRRQEVSSRRRAKRTIVNRIKSIESRLEELFAEESVTDKIAQINTDIRRTNTKRVNKLVEVERLLGKYLELMFQQDEKTLEFAKLNILLENENEKISEQDRRFAALEEAKEAARADMSNVKRDARRLKSDAMRVCQLEELKEAEEEWDNVKGVTEYSDDPAQITNTITACEISLSKIVVNRAEHERFLNRERTIAELEVKVKERDEKNAIHKAKIHELKSQWLPALKDKVRRISERYRGFFGNLRRGCDAKIVLREDDDFDKYALDIMVKFRANGDLKTLSGTTQSGGERSVATMLYLLCLQDVTTCPFRVVDEINQGMDPNNELMIFEQVLRCSRMEGSPQLFMITPKLHPDMDFQGVCIFFVMNGPWINLPWGIQKAVRGAVMNGAGVNSRVGG
eukprot:381817_1